MYDLDGVPDPDVVRFVGDNIRSLLTWDIVVFFHKNPDAALDVPGIASRLGRRPDEIESEIGPLCETEILQRTDDRVRYAPSTDVHRAISGFVEACTDRGRRLALIALVLHNLGGRGASGSTSGF